MEKLLPQGHHSISHSLVLLLSLLLLGSTACKKVEETFPVDEQIMPAATQEGKGTFGCLVDGKLWLPYNPNAGSLFPLDYELSTNTFPINASNLTVDIKNYRGKTEIGVMSLTLGYTSAITPGVYPLSSGFKATANNNHTDTAAAGLELYSTANGGSGTLTITRVEPVTKTVNGITTRSTIVSGTFQFVARSQNGKTITVTDGRFDVSPFQ